MRSTFSGFPKHTIGFLKKLQKNNNREWFKVNKETYEAQVREPALAFIECMQDPLRKISPHFLASPKKSGGSLMRVYRDTRFSKDKTPHKTNIGMHFRHALGKDVHAPGFYVHIEPGMVFIGVGIWRPDGPALAKIREHILDNPNAWKKVKAGKRFVEKFSLGGESLVRPPKGVAADHPLLEDLKRKDFLASYECPQSLIHSDALLKEVVDGFTRAKPFVAFLCDALEVPL